MLNPRYFKMFKKSSKKKGAIRKRKLSEDEEQKDDEVDQDEMEKLKLAKLKRELLTKKAGVSAVALAKGKKISKKAELTDDPFKLKSGKTRLICLTQDIGGRYVLKVMFPLLHSAGTIW